MLLFGDRNAKAYKQIKLTSEELEIKALLEASWRELLDAGPYAITMIGELETESGVQVALCFVEDFLFVECIGPVFEDLELHTLFLEQEETNGLNALDYKVSMNVRKKHPKTRGLWDELFVGQMGRELVDQTAKWKANNKLRRGDKTAGKIVNAPFDFESSKEYLRGL